MRSVESLSGEEIRTFTGHTKWIDAIAISPNGQTLVSAGGDKTIKIWHLAVKTSDSSPLIRTLSKPSGKPEGWGVENG